MASAKPSPAATEVVAIDGPSGAGKSTVARRVAAALGFAYLDTGAMYRAVTWFLLERAFHDLDDEAGLGALLAEVQLELRPGGKVAVRGRDVTNHLRSREVEARVSAVSASPTVRAYLGLLQREMAARGPLVAEGRDMASVVFPAARWKYFLDADPAERARRRQLDFQQAGRKVSPEEVEEEIAVRDSLDSSRRDAPLRRAPGAVLVDTTGLTIDGVVEAICRRVRADLEADAAR